MSEQTQPLESTTPEASTSDMQRVPVILSGAIEATIPAWVAARLDGRHHRIRAAYRDLSCSGSGGQTYRRALTSPAESSWASEHPEAEDVGDRLPRLGGGLASERRCAQHVTLPAGTAILDYASNVHGYRAGVASLTLGLVVAPGLDDAGQPSKSTLLWEGALGWTSSRRQSGARLELGTGRCLDVL